jgi:hypothetical protein
MTLRIVDFLDFFRCLGFKITRKHKVSVNETVFFFFKEEEEVSNLALFKGPLTGGVPFPSTEEGKKSM